MADIDNQLDRAVWHVIGQAKKEASKPIPYTQVSVMGNFGQRSGLETSGGKSSRHRDFVSKVVERLCAMGINANSTPTGQLVVVHFPLPSRFING